MTATLLEVIAATMVVLFGSFTILCLACLAGIVSAL